MQKQTARTQESGHLLVASATMYLFLQVRSTYLSGQRVVSDLKMVGAVGDGTHHDQTTFLLQPLGVGSG